MEGRKDSGEHLIAMKVRELVSLENEFAMKTKEFEVRELERQNKLEEKRKLLDLRSLEMDSKERDLSLREDEMRAQLEGIMKEESELRLGEKKLDELEENLDVEIMMNDLKDERFSRAGSTQEPDRSIRSDQSAAKKSRKTIELDSSGKEIGESSRSRAHASDSVRNIERERMNQGDDEIFFSMTMSQTHSYQNHVCLPKAFISAFNWSGKTHVILLTDEGSFCLEVRNYDMKQVLFRRGWRDFYRKNRLSIGMRCLFRLKELSVDGDTSVFSMDVTITGR